MRTHIGWRGKRNILIRVWKPLPSMGSKTLRRTPSTISRAVGFSIVDRFKTQKEKSKEDKI